MIATAKRPAEKSKRPASKRRLAEVRAAIVKGCRETLRQAKRIVPVVAPHARRLRARIANLARRVGRRLRPAAAFFFRVVAATERELRRAGRALARWATRASAVITPGRAICAVVLASAVCLVVSQFIDYRGVEIGQPGYAGLPSIATPPTVAVRTAGEAHSYLLIPLALLAAVAAVAALSPRRRRLGGVVFALGLVALAVILLVDMPDGLEASAQASQFSGAHATLESGFYGELAAAAGIALGGLALTLMKGPASDRSKKRRRRTLNRDKSSRGGAPSLAESGTS